MSESVRDIFANSAACQVIYSDMGLSGQFDDVLALERFLRRKKVLYDVARLHMAFYLGEIWVRHFPGAVWNIHGDVEKPDLMVELKTPTGTLRIRPERIIEDAFHFTEQSLVITTDVLTALVEGRCSSEIQAG